MEDADYVKILPSVVIIQRVGENGKDKVRAYLVRSRNWEEYVRLTSGRPDTVDVKEEVAKKLGYPIKVKDFEDAVACQIRYKYFLDESAYSIFATEFKRMPSNIIPERAD